MAGVSAKKSKKKNRGNAQRSCISLSRSNALYSAHINSIRRAAAGYQRHGSGSINMATSRIASTAYGGIVAGAAA